MTRGCRVCVSPLFIFFWKAEVGHILGYYKKKSTRSTASTAGASGDQNFFKFDISNFLTSNIEVCKKKQWEKRQDALLKR
jgi:hypothetical protein